MKKMIGVVTWFNKAKGYGELLGEDGKTYFFTHLEIKSRSLFKIAVKDQVYEFQISKNEKFGNSCATGLSLTTSKSKIQRFTVDREI